MISSNHQTHKGSYIRAKSATRIRVAGPKIGDVSGCSTVASSKNAESEGESPPGTREGFSNAVRREKVAHMARIVLTLGNAGAISKCWQEARHANSAGRKGRRPGWPRLGLGGLTLVRDCEQKRDRHGEQRNTRKAEYTNCRGLKVNQ